MITLRQLRTRLTSRQYPQQKLPRLVPNPQAVVFPRAWLLPLVVKTEHMPRLIHFAHPDDLMPALAEPYDYRLIQGLAYLGDKIWNEVCVEVGDELRGRVIDACKDTAKVSDVSSCMDWWRPDVVGCAFRLDPLPVTQLSLSPRCLTR